MSGTAEDGRISNLHLKGDPVRIYEPAIVPDPLPQSREQEQSEHTPESSTIVRGQD